MLGMILRAGFVSLFVSFVAALPVEWFLASENEDFYSYCRESGEIDPECSEYLEQLRQFEGLDTESAQKLEYQTRFLKYSKFGMEIIWYFVPVFLGCVLLGFWEQKSPSRYKPRDAT